MRIEKSRKSNPKPRFSTLVVWKATFWDTKRSRLIDPPKKTDQKNIAFGFFTEPVWSSQPCGRRHGVALVRLVLAESSCSTSTAIPEEAQLSEGVKDSTLCRGGFGTEKSTKTIFENMDEMARSHFDGLFGWVSPTIPSVRGQRADPKDHQTCTNGPPMIPMMHAPCKRSTSLSKHARRLLFVLLSRPPDRPSKRRKRISKRPADGQRCSVRDAWK